MSETPLDWWRRFRLALVLLLAAIGGSSTWLYQSWRTGHPHYMIGPSVLTVVFVVWLLLGLRTISNPERHYVWERVLYRRPPLGSPASEIPVPDLPDRFDPVGCLPGLVMAALIPPAGMIYFTIESWEAGEVLWAVVETVIAVAMIAVLIKLIKPPRRKRSRRTGRLR